MSHGGKKKGGGGGSRDRSRSPVDRSESAPAPNSTGNDALSREDLMDLMTEAMSAQIPRLILETSKVVSAQMQADQQQVIQEQARSFTSFPQDMKQMKLRQEEVEAHAKAANLKSEGFHRNLLQ